MPVEILVSSSQPSPAISVDAAGAVICEVAPAPQVQCKVEHNTLAGAINNPGGSQGDVQVKNGTGFAGIAPGAAGNLLTSNGTAWESQPPAALPSNVVTAALSIDGNYLELTFGGNTYLVPRIDA